MSAQRDHENPAAEYSYCIKEHTVGWRGSKFNHQFKTASFWVRADGDLVLDVQCDEVKSNDKVYTHTWEYHLPPEMLVELVQYLHEKLTKKED